MTEYANNSTDRQRTEDPMNMKGNGAHKSRLIAFKTKSRAGPPIRGIHRKFISRGVITTIRKITLEQVQDRFQK